MTEAALIQLCLTVGGIFTAMFVTIRYSIGEGNKKQKEFLDFIDKMETKQLDYYESKNGHLERISKMFTVNMNKHTKAIEKMALEIRSIKKK